MSRSVEAQGLAALLNLDAHLEMGRISAAAEQPAAAVLPSAAQATASVPTPDAAAEAPPAPTIAATATRAEKPPMAAAVNTLGRVGPYELKAALAHDGLGQIYQAWDSNEGVAVMLTLLDLESDARDREVVIAQLQKSVLAASGLQHPGLARIHDAGVVGAGVYIVNQWLTGRTLAQAQLAGWQPTARVAAQLVHDLAKALAHAHAFGVVHGGLNPSTVMLDADDKPIVLGLGFACPAHASDLPSMDPLVSGAAPYLSPEQLLGGTVDARTDVHALGVLLYELLTARRAYPSATVPEVARALMAHDPAPPHWLRLDVPERLSAIAMQALQRNPAARYAHASEVATALDAWLQHSEHETDDARNAFVAAQALPLPQRRKKNHWLSASLVLAAAVVVAFSWTEQLDPALSGRAPPAAEVVAATDEVSAKPAAPAGDMPQGAPARATDTVAALVTPAAIPMQTANATDAPAASATRPATAPVVQPKAAAGSAVKAQAGPAKAAPREKTRPALADAKTPAAAVQTGTVQLAVSPWGYVEVGGKVAGATPPLHKLTLPAGTHTITIRNEDFAPYVTTVQVTADKAATVRHRFTQ